MSNDDHTGQLDASDSEVLLGEVVATYLRSVERGQPLDREALLTAHPQYADELAAFLANHECVERISQPLRTLAPAAEAATQAAVRIRYFGDYELLEQIAQGGMGVVYKARQISLNRLVAVKMIRSGLLASDSDVKRFAAEAESAANLRHPGIVAIYEVGVHDGQHYYSMEYVEGRDLSQIVRDNPLSHDQAAAYVRQMAEIIEFSHSQGVLHRDLKPANVLIDPAGRVRITDFGLAKRVGSDSDLTTSGQVIGTPKYMSPEQAAAQHALIGPASDVYALGSILYELLTGRAPFRSDSAIDILRQIQQDDPVRPKILNARLPKDLETICLKCLEKEPRRRYASAQYLADELGRFLRGEPIRARRTNAFVRWTKFTRRRPSVAALVVLSIVLPLCMIGIIVVTHHDLMKERMKTEIAEETTKRIRATTGQFGYILSNETYRQLQFFRALRLLNRLIEAESASRDMVMLLPTSPELRDKLTNAFTELETIQRELQVALNPVALGDKLQQTLNRNPVDPTTRLELAKSLIEMGSILRAARPQDAEAACEKAVSLTEGLVREFPGVPEYRTALAKSYYNRAGDLAYRVKFLDAELAYRQALNAEETLSIEFADNLDHQRWLTQCWTEYGSVLQNQAKTARAVNALQKAAAIAQKLTEQSPDTPDNQILLARVRFKLANAIQLDGNALKAVDQFQLATRTLNGLSEKPLPTRQRWNLAESIAEIGDSLRDLGNTAQTESAHKQAIQIWEQFVRDYPFNEELRIVLARSYIDFAHALRTERRYVEAFEWYDKALLLLENITATHRNSDKHQSAIQIAANSRSSVIVRVKQESIAYIRAERSDQALAHIGQLLKHAEDLRRDRSMSVFLGPVYYNAASVYARASAREMSNADAAERYAVESVSLLTRALECGYFKPTAALYYLKEDNDFELLRHREDFQKLCARIDNVRIKLSTY